MLLYTFDSKYSSCSYLLYHSAWAHCLDHAGNSSVRLVELCRRPTSDGLSDRGFRRQTTQSVDATSHCQHKDFNA